MRIESINLKPKTLVTGLPTKDATSTTTFSQ